MKPETRILTYIHSRSVETDMWARQITAIYRVITASYVPCSSGHCYVQFFSVFHRKMSAQTAHKVFVTRYVPPVGVELLSRHFQVSQWDSQDPIPRTELLERVKGIDGLYCFLTERIDKEVLDAAGIFSRFVVLSL